jgi:hypothetical protein
VGWMESGAGEHWRADRCYSSFCFLGLVSWSRFVLFASKRRAEDSVAVSCDSSGQMTAWSGGGSTWCRREERFRVISEFQTSRAPCVEVIGYRTALLLTELFGGTDGWKSRRGMKRLVFGGKCWATASVRRPEAKSVC